jgi:hypothetical protein
MDADADDIYNRFRSAGFAARRLSAKRKSAPDLIVKLPHMSLLVEVKRPGRNASSKKDTPFVYRLSGQLRKAIAQFESVDPDRKRLRAIFMYLPKYTNSLDVADMLDGATCSSDGKVWTPSEAYLSKGHFKLLSQTDLFFWQDGCGIVRVRGKPHGGIPEDIINAIGSKLLDRPQ